MKVINKYFKTGALILAVCSFFAVSCSTDEAIYTPTNDDISFAVSAATYTLDGSALTVYINRGVANKAVTVPISMTDQNNVFTCSTNSISFAAGEYSKSFEITYDINDFTPGKDYVFTMTFSGAGSPATNASMKGTAKLPFEYIAYSKLECTDSEHYVKGTGWVSSATMPYFSDLADPNAKLEIAKYTTSYFKLSIYNGVTIEFYVDEDGNCVIDKYTGYNDNLTILDASAANFEFSFKNSYNGHSYYFDCPNFGWAYKAGAYNVIYIQYWAQYDGAWANGGYPIYEEFSLVDKLDN